MRRLSYCQREREDRFERSEIINLERDSYNT